MKELQGVSYPDQKLTLSAIASYANAMGLDQEKVQVFYQALKDGEGNSFVVAAAADGTPVLIADNNEKSTKYVWQEITLRQLADKTGLKIGTQLHPDLPTPRAIKKEQFNAATMTWVWSSREPTEGVWNNSYDFRQRDEAQEDGMQFLRLSHVLDSNTYPDWLLAKDDSALMQSLRDHIRKVMETYTQFGITQFNVVNEPYDTDSIIKRLGRNQYVLMAFEEANKVRAEIQEKAKEEGKPIPTIELGLSNAENHFAQGGGTNQTKDLLGILAPRGLIDYVDVHFHIKETKNRPSPMDTKDTLAAYRNYINPKTSKPIKVVVGELDVDIADISGSKLLEFRLKTIEGDP